MEDYNAINSFPRPSLPRGFRSILHLLSKEVLREQPLNIYEFCAEFFGKRLLDRGDSWVDFKERYNKRRREEEEARRRAMPKPITEDTVDERPLDDYTEEEEKAIVKIQAGVRGMLVRRGSKDLSHAAEERWKHPEAQLRRDLVTVSESISFAALEATDGSWEAAQRWLHPAQQLVRDLDTVSEPVTVAELRSRGSSLQDVPSAAPTAPPPSRTPSSPEHSDISLGDAGPWDPHDPRHVSRPGDSLDSLRSPRHSEISLGDTGPAAPYDPSQRAQSLEALSAECVVPSERAPSAPLPPPGVDTDEGRRTTGSRLDLAGEEQWEPAGRAGSPPEARSPAHSDIDVAGE